MTETYLTVKWTVSRGRLTYGYNVCTLTDTDTRKKYRVNGGGYDMLGSVFGMYLQDVHQDALWDIRERAYRTVSVGNDASGGELYGMTWREDSVTVDGACGLESMLRIAKAAGIKVRKLVSNGQVDGFIVSAGDESE